MNLTDDKIGQILYSINDNYHLLNKMAPLEIDRLVELIMGLINNLKPNQGLAKDDFIQALEESKSAFGYLNLVEILNIDELLSKINQA